MKKDFDKIGNSEEPWFCWSKITEKENKKKILTGDFNINLLNFDSFFPHTARLWNSLPIKCFPLTYDLNGFKSRIKDIF